MKFQCVCGRTLRAPETAVGRRGRCPACGKIFTVPSPVIEPLPAPVPSLEDYDESVPSGETEDGEIPLAAAPAPIERRSHSIYMPAQTTSAPPPQTLSYAAPPKAVLPLEKSFTSRGHLYWVLLIVLIPLAWSTFHKGDDQESLRQRVQRTAQMHPEIQDRLENLPDHATLDDLFKIFPGHKLEGALLPRDTWMHWVFAALSAAAFMAFVLLLFPPGHTRVPQLLKVGLFTGTAGILLLLAFQWLSFHVGFIVPRGIIGLLWDIVALIGQSYRLALTDHGFLLSFLGFTAGVGFCEEVCKALPMVVKARISGFVSWRTAMLWGLVSGVGFGVSEGITYSSDYYNGIHGGVIYLVRFISCVGLHAIWAAAVGIDIHRQQDIFRGELHVLEWLWRLLQVVIVPMILHGLYDTLLKQKYDLFALLTALASFGWLALQIELAKRKFDAQMLAA